MIKKTPLKEIKLNSGTSQAARYIFQVLFDYYFNNGGSLDLGNILIDYDLIKKYLERYEPFTFGWNLWGGGSKETQILFKDCLTEEEFSNALDWSFDGKMIRCDVSLDVAKFELWESYENL